MPDEPAYRRSYRTHGYHSDARTGDLLRALEVISEQLASGFDEVIRRLDRDWEYQERLRRIKQGVGIVRLPRQLVPEDEPDFLDDDYAHADEPEDQA